MLPNEADDEFPINSIGFYRDSLLGPRRSNCCRCTKADVILGLLCFNIILSLAIIAGVSWFFGPANDMVNYYQGNKAQMNMTIHKVTRMLYEADDILRMVIDFKSFVTDKVMGALCQSTVTRAVIGRFCSEPNTLIGKRNFNLVEPLTLKEIILLLEILDRSNVENNKSPVENNIT